VVEVVQTPDWRLAVVFNRHPFHELGCNSDWGRIPHLVDRRTPFAALAIPWDPSARVASIHCSRELGKEENQTDLSAETTESVCIVATMNRVLSLLRDGSATFPGNGVYQDLGVLLSWEGPQQVLLQQFARIPS
jgi:hypothetical protein